MVARRSFKCIQEAVFRRQYSALTDKSTVYVDSCHCQIKPLYNCVSENSRFYDWDWANRRLSGWCPEKMFILYRSSPTILFSFCLWVVLQSELLSCLYTFWLVPRWLFYCRKFKICTCISWWREQMVTETQAGQVKPKDLVTLWSDVRCYSLHVSELLQTSRFHLAWKLSWRSYRARVRVSLKPVLFTGLEIIISILEIHHIFVCSICFQVFAASDLDLVGLNLVGLPGSKVRTVTFPRVKYLKNVENGIKMPVVYAYIPTRQYLKVYICR